jgi:hypothetical protein
VPVPGLPQFPNGSFASRSLRMCAAIVSLISAMRSIIALVLRLAGA